MKPTRRTIVALAAAAVVILTAGAGTYAYAGGSGGPEATLEDAGAQEVDADVAREQPKLPVPTAEHDCGDTGEYQEDLEGYLAELGGYGEVFVDGEQSKEDCDAITAFQERFGISPAEGYAGDVTYRVAKRLVESDLDECDSGDGLTVCVDLTHQTLWVADGDEVVFGPTVVRTGMAGYATQPGTHEITNKAESEWSKPYKVWLPYWQHFYMGQGLHQTTTYIHDEWNGSHGCVNLLPDDAVELYEMLDVGDQLHIFGRRPGT
ncbi:MAG: L,D-transpeptidase [Stackebrandtia sp.]